MKELIKIFEIRKRELTNLLVNNSQDIGPEKQHQIYGAILEIDVFLQTLRNRLKKIEGESDFY